MPRGAKRDSGATAARYEYGVFKDARKRSFVSTNGDYFLYGVDMSRQRRDVLARDKKCCMVCGKFVGTRGEIDHFPISRGRGGDDSMDNLRTVCHKCHTARHNREPKWSTNENR